MRKINVIEVEITDHLRGGISPAGVGHRYVFLATERAPGVWRVNDGQADFTFTQAELDNEYWIKLRDQGNIKL